MENVSEPKGTFEMHFPERTRLQKAECAIARLSMNRPDLAPIRYIGGNKPLSKEEQAENARRRAKYWQERLDLIAQHQAEEEFLEPLRSKRYRLQREIETVCVEIKELEALLATRLNKEET